MLLPVPTHVLFQSLHRLPIPHWIQNKINTRCYKCIMHTLFHLISVSVFNFTHPPILSALLLILSASRFLAPDFPVLVPVPFPSLAPWHGMTFPFLSDRTLSGLLQIKPEDISFPKTIDLPCFSFHAAVFLCLKSLLFVVHLSCV